MVQKTLSPPEEHVRAKVREALASYDEVEQSIRDRLSDYLVTGEDATCLLELAAAYQDDSRKRFFKRSSGAAPRPADRIERRKLLELFQIRTAPPGYYRRLGEVAGHVPEAKQTQAQIIESDERLSPWLRDLAILRWLLNAEDGYYFYASRPDETFKLQPWLRDLESPEEVAALIAMVVSSGERSYNHISRYVQNAGDWPAILTSHSAEFTAALRAASAGAREATLNWLLPLKFDFGPVLPAIVELAVSPSKRVRPLAINVLRDRPLEEFRQLLVEQLNASDAATRGNAAEALAATLGPEAEPFLRAALAVEKATRVAQTLESLLRNVASPDAAAQESAVVELPPLSLPVGEVPLPPEFAQQLREQLNTAFEKLDQQYEKQLAAFHAPDKPAWMRQPAKPVRMDEKEFRRILDFIEGKSDKAPIKSNWARQAACSMPVWSKWTDLTKLQLIHVVRFLKAFDLLNNNYILNLVRDDWLESHRSAQSQPYGLREVDAAVAALKGFEAGAVATTYLHNNVYRSILEWEPEAVWPVFVEHLALFRDAILGLAKHKNDYWVNNRRRMAMRVAAMMPKLPREIENAMWSLALGESKTDRPAARRALQTAENRLERALEGLEDGRQGTRIAAAEMLAELGDTSAVEPLKKALKKEKIEIVKGSLLQAIEQLGGDVDEFLGRRKQLLDAQKGLAKKRPKGMEWIPLATLPRVRWADDGKPVAKEILQWWVVQSVQFKLPVCGPILRRSMAMCRRDDAAAFAKYLLSAWIAYDTKTPTREEAVAEATKQAAQQWSMPHAQWLHEHYRTEEKLRDHIASQIQNSFLQSAIDQKGLLAIVAAAGDAQCVKSMERYIRTHHGHRLAQCKAMIETLAWIDDASAVQLLLSLGNRFRTKAIRKRAAELVDELAQRQGWTMDQLGDRTIPDAGFTREEDAEGNPIGARAELILDYGPRKFVVILGDDLQPVITRDDGKTVKALPNAAKDDDPELVKAAKKGFSDAKKMVKEVVKSQAERLYEAACVQRTWPAAEWRRYLAQHPIAGALCRRVVWAARGADQSEPLRLFRPLEDGTLTDVNDDEFTLGDEDVVSVAHSSLLDEATEQAWKQHLQDYEVPQLFQQFGRQTFRLPKEKENDTGVLDFRGHMLTTFRLRSRATKLGWMRGDAEDGGSFSIYYKPFRSQRIQAVVEFTGSFVPEQDIPAAIRELYFVPLKPNDDSSQSWNPNKLRLGKVPPVLLSECYNDVREMAAEGTGFDPQWEKKGLW
jgi:HEAT repeat protein